MSTTVATSGYLVESTVIEAPLAQVWHLLKLQDFSKFWTALSKTSVAKDTSDETDVYNWTFKDGTQLVVKQEEHSSINHSISYSVIDAQPALTYTSVLSTISLFPVTSGALEGSTFIQWSGNFSSDADAGVIADARFKRKEALADLAKAVKAT